MPQLLPNAFTCYKLTEQERIIGSTFNELQLCVIQNELYLAAQEKLNLKYDPLNPNDFVQTDAAVTGKMVALQLLIANHEAAQDEFMRLQVLSAKTQQ